MAREAIKANSLSLTDLAGRVLSRFLRLSGVYEWLVQGSRPRSDGLRRGSATRSFEACRLLCGVIDRLRPHFWARCTTVKSFKRLLRPGAVF